MPSVIFFLKNQKKYTIQNTKMLPSYSSLYILCYNCCVKQNSILYSLLVKYLPQDSLQILQDLHNKVVHQLDIPVRILRVVITIKGLDLRLELLPP